MDSSPRHALDRHALVTSLWVAFGFVAVALFHHGFGQGGPIFVLAAFGMILLAFAGHIIVNAVLGSVFTANELVLGLVIYAVSLLVFGLATLLSPGFGARNFLVLSLGFLAILIIVVTYMITHFGLRRAFDAFNVIQTFKPGSEPADGRSRSRRR